LRIDLFFSMESSVVRRRRLVGVREPLGRDFHEHGGAAAGSTRDRKPAVQSFRPLGHSQQPKSILLQSFPVLRVKSTTVVAHAQQDVLRAKLEFNFYPAGARM